MQRPSLNRAVWTWIATGALVLALACTSESDGANPFEKMTGDSPVGSETNALANNWSPKAEGGRSQLPSDAPVYPGAEVEETAPGPDGRIKQISISKAPAEKVYESMGQQLEADGWDIRSRMNDNGQFALDASKDTRRAAVLIADGKILKNAGTPDTRITVLVSP